MRKFIRKIYNRIKGEKIIMIHHVGQADEYSPCSLQPDKFEAFLQKAEFVAVSEGLKRISRNDGKLILTVDDGLCDLYSNVYRLCKKYGVPFTAFISADLLDSAGYITAEQLKEMAKDPLVTIASHGATHRKLDSLSLTELKKEIVGSKEKIEVFIGRPVEFFAYPNGAYKKEAVKTVKKAGYKYAFGVVPRKTNFLTKIFSRYNLPRYNLTDKTYNSEHHGEQNKEQRE